MLADSGLYCASCDRSPYAVEVRDARIQDKYAQVVVLVDQKEKLVIENNKQKCVYHKLLWSFGIFGLVGWAAFLMLLIK
jgi:hypothetical protein